MTDQNAKLIKYPIGLVLIGLPLYLVRFSVLGIPTTLLEIIIYLIFIFYFLFFTLGQAKFYFPDRRWLIPIGLFVVGAAIGIVISSDKRLAFGQFKGFIFDPILFGWILYSALRSKLVNREWIVYSLLGGGLLLSIGAFWFPNHLDGRSLSFYWYELNPNPNYLALMLAPLAALAFSKVKYWLWGLFGTIMTIALFTTGSRGGFVGLGLAILYILYKKYKKTRKAVITLAFAFLALTFYLARPNLSANPDAGRISSSNNIRYEIWKTTAEIVIEKPRNFLFGVGLGNYQNYFTNLTKDRVNYPEFIAPRALTPHNIFLAIWLNGGLLMLAGFVWLVFKIFRSAGFVPAQAAMVAILGHGLVDTPYFKNDLSVLFWVFIVLVLVSETSIV